MSAFQSCTPCEPGTHRPTMTLVNFSICFATKKVWIITRLLVRWSHTLSISLPHYVTTLDFGIFFHGKVWGQSIAWDRAGRSHHWSRLQLFPTWKMPSSAWWLQRWCPGLLTGRARMCCEGAVILFPIFPTRFFLDKVLKYFYYFPPRIYLVLFRSLSFPLNCVSVVLLFGISHVVAGPMCTTFVVLASYWGGGRCNSLVICLYASTQAEPTIFGGGGSWQSHSYNFPCQGGGGEGVWIGVPRMRF